MNPPDRRPQAGRWLPTAWFRRDQDREAHARELTGGKVAGGPFRGLHYAPTAAGIPAAPKLIGTYEKELEGLIDNLLWRGYERLVDVGAGDGFHVVGFLTRCADLGAVAFEADGRHGPIIRELARFNGVANRLRVEGHCTHSLLARALAGGRRSLVLCDIEGGEMELLDPRKIPLLASTDILVEVHDPADATTSRALRERFRSTHKIETILGRERTIDDLPARWRSRRYLPLLSESRSGAMAWLWMERRATPLPKPPPLPLSERVPARPIG